MFVEHHSRLLTTPTSAFIVFRISFLAIALLRSILTSYSFKRYTTVSAIARLSRSSDSYFKLSLSTTRHTIVVRDADELAALNLVLVQHFFDLFILETSQNRLN